MPNADFDASRMLERRSYEAIADYAVIGDCHSAALISRSGSVDWYCLPDFSSASVFGALLDRRKGGCLSLAPRAIAAIDRRYVERSAVLETIYRCESGVLTVTDFMPMPAELAERRLIRTIECSAGAVDVEVLYQPRPDYAKQPVTLEPRSSGWRLPLGEGVLDLDVESPWTLQAHGDLAAGLWHLDKGARTSLVLSYRSCADSAQQPAAVASLVASWLANTRRWWEQWCGRCDYEGAYQAIVMRSCMTLKLLTHRSTGAVLAAITTSLPESLEDGRNWDYRFCWLRDTSLLLQSFLDMGFRRESAQFLGWLLEVGRTPRLQPFYDLRGCPAPDEIELSHWEGWRGCGPVRIGNSANRQLQLDIYGELIHTAYRFVCHGGGLGARKRALLVSLGEAVMRYWREPDQGIWEIRGPPRHHTYSKMMCWVALDPLLKLDRQLGLGVAVDEIARERDLIRTTIDRDGYDAKLGAYVGYFGGTDPDASLLLMLRYGYLAHDDPRTHRTYRFIVDRLGVDGLLYRYPQNADYDGLSGAENLFMVCNFWAVDHLARSGAVDEAVRLFERLLGFASDLGLYAEQYAVDDGAALGNFPQAFSHSGLITAAIAIAQAHGGRRGEAIAS